MSAPWTGPMDEEQTLTPQRAEVCRRVAFAMEFTHSCHICAACLQPGAVIGFMRDADLVAHLAEEHGVMR